MSIPNFRTYKNKASASYQNILYAKTSVGMQINKLHSLWINTGTPGAGSAPTTSSVTCSSATTGSLGQSDSNGVQRLIQAEAINGDTGYNMIICDRLVHMAGLDGQGTGSAQIVSSSALPRYTNGIGVFAAVEIYVAIGSTGASCSASYTNEQGQSGRTSGIFVIGGNNVNGSTTARAMIIIPLAQGDVGIRSVETITVGSLTGISGNFGITLFKPLFNISGLIGDDGQGQIFDGILGGAGNLPIIQNGACIYGIMKVGNVLTPNNFLNLKFIEE